jgi:23S rRNA pseudouridine1911/1915/1917 synthase
VHRLDKDTSGILLLALTSESDRAFKMLLEGTRSVPAGVDPTVRKSYRAITWGAPEDGLIDAPLEPDEHPLRVKMRLASPGRGLEARTRVTVEQRVAGYALVRCELFTGRQHQIRVHLASRGTPVVGDRLYGPNDELHRRGADGILSEDDLRVLEMPRQALHAARYALPHALTWQPLEFECPLPSDMSEFWLRVGGSLRS